MAVGGVRDLSLITTPPVDRRAVRTIVTRFDEQVLREAVTRELARGGQVFYVYNRIEGIYEKAQRLQQLVPTARIAVGHGRCRPREQQKTQPTATWPRREGALEKVMLDFVEGRYDILCATAIVESGLDIPRANTMIIDRADLFGLAQLYQLRGRVGRSKERAYCYLVVPPAERADRRGALAHRGARAAHGARERVQDRVARPRAARRGRSARRRSNRGACRASGSICSAR